MKRYAVVFEESAQADVRDLTIGVIASGARKRPSSGPVNYGLPFKTAQRNSERLSVGARE